MEQRVMVDAFLHSLAEGSCFCECRPYSEIGMMPMIFKMAIMLTSVVIGSLLLVIWRQRLLAARLSSEKLHILV